MKLPQSPRLSVLARKSARRFGIEINRVDQRTWADHRTLGKAERLEERFREVVSDPLGFLIPRVPDAGYVTDDKWITLHNGMETALRGYYGDFSDILIVNRGVHEPLEEFAFSAWLAHEGYSKSSMVELGSYSAQYSMWLKHAYPDALCCMVEPIPEFLEVGRRNFDRNHLHGEFISAEIGSSPGAASVADICELMDMSHLSMLHADIQGAEMEMLVGAHRLLQNRSIDLLFISTHSRVLHEGVDACLREHGYRIELSSEPERHTTSYDGFVAASRSDLPPLLPGLEPMGRLDILESSIASTLDYMEKARAYSLWYPTEGSRGMSA